jgi:hypothetical protein
MASPSSGITLDSGVCKLFIATLRLDGPTQHRRRNERIVVEYATLMRQGVEFPPIRVWYDGAYYWVSDGFHRVAAAEKAAFSDITAEVLFGSQSDAQWDSFSANGRHGLRWTRSESQRVIELTLSHPNASSLSNVEVAKHVNVSEKTIRRWRRRLSSALAEDTTRVVKRGDSIYSLSTTNIGRADGSRRLKSREEIRSQLNSMKQQAQPKARRVLVVFNNWAFGAVTAKECLEALHRVISE